ncbi:MAG TPA: hypothetical protein EYH34_02310, partial [Planctomycetes bacterium]|nr:hypothetical protein [Planctomycetota bacterium]
MSNAEAFVQPPEPSLVGMSSYLHAFRRRWVSALSLGVTCAALAGAAVWFGLRPTYTATALLRVAAHQEKLVFPTVDHAAQSSFDVYKNTQQQLLRSRFTLTAALRDPAVARLPLVQNELDPVGWLMRELEINFPGEAEIMQVSLTLSDPAQAATLVNAVVQAFMREVVNVERDRRVERLNELDQLCAEKETEVRSKRAALRQLAEQLGAGYTEALSLRQQVILQQFAAIRKELTQAEFELRRTRSEIKVREALLKKTSTPTVSQLEVDVAAENDPITSTLVGRIMSCRAKLTEAKETFQPEYAERFAVPLRRVLSALQKQLDARREELRKRLEQRKLAENDAELQRLQSQEALLAEQVRELTQDLKEVSDQAQQVGGSSIDVEMMRVEIQHIEAALNSIAEERERLRVELRTGSRITLVQPATTPTSPDRTTKPGLAVLAGLAGFFIPVWGVTRWEVGKHRISSCREVSKVLGLNTIGAVPRIPPWAIRRLDAPSRRCQRWRAVMKESVDAVGAMVLRRAQSDQLRVILVSSAVNGEGKTTLATHLARSLASSGYRTLL